MPATYGTPLKPRAITDPTIQDLCRDSPARPVEWRWERARLAIEIPRLSEAFPHDSDKAIRDAIEYQRAHANCQGDMIRIMRLRRQKKPIWMAHRLRIDMTEGGMLRRAELEARLLARDTTESIFDRMQLDYRVVDWYEKLFFNVSDRIDNRGWIAHNVMGATYHAGMTERDHETLWKMFGYCGGPAVLDLVIDKDLVGVRPKRGEDLTSYTSDHAKNTAALRSMIAIRTAPIDRNTWHLMVEIHQKFIELKQQAEGEGAGSRDVFNSHMKDFLDNLPWVLGGHPTPDGRHSPVEMVSAKDPKSIVGTLPPVLINADREGRELRSSELHDIVNGQAITWLGEVKGSAFQDREEEAEDDYDGTDDADDEGVGEPDQEGS